MYHLQETKYQIKLTIVMKSGKLGPYLLANTEFDLVVDYLDVDHALLLNIVEPGITQLKCPPPLIKSSNIILVANVQTAWTRTRPGLTFPRATSTCIFALTKHLA